MCCQRKCQTTSGTSCFFYEKRRRKLNKLLRIYYEAIKRFCPSRELLTILPYLWYYGHKGRGARCIYGTGGCQGSGGQTLRNTAHITTRVMKRPFILITICIWIFPFPCKFYNLKQFLCYLIIFPGNFSIKKKKESKGLACLQPVALACRKS